MGACSSKKGGDGNVQMDIGKQRQYQKEQQQKLNGNKPNASSTNESANKETHEININNIVIQNEAQKVKMLMTDHNSDNDQLVRRKTLIDQLAQKQTMEELTQTIQKSFLQSMKNVKSSQLNQNTTFEYLDNQENLQSDDLVKEIKKLKNQNGKYLENIGVQEQKLVGQIAEEYIQQNNHLQQLQFDHTKVGINVLKTMYHQQLEINLQTQLYTDYNESGDKKMKTNTLECLQNSVKTSLEQEKELVNTNGGNEQLYSSVGRQVYDNQENVYMSAAVKKQNVQNVDINPQKMGGNDDDNKDIDHISSLDENVEEDVKSKLGQQITNGVVIQKSKFK